MASSLLLAWVSLLLLATAGCKPEASSAPPQKQVTEEVPVAISPDQEEVPSPEVTVPTEKNPTEAEPASLDSETPAAEDEPVEESAPPAKPKVEQTGETTFQYGEVSFDSATREIRFPGIVNHDMEVLEYAIVHEQGKVHEALLTTKVKPFELQVAMLLLKYKPYRGDLFEGFAREGNGDDAPDDEDKKAEPKPSAEQFMIDIQVEWKAPDGSAKNAPLASWLFNFRKEEGMDPKTKWRFIGLLQIPGNPYNPEHEKSMAAVYLDPFSPLNFDGVGARDDETWVPHPTNLPPLDTSVTIVLKPSKPAPAQ